MSVPHGQPPSEREEIRTGGPEIWSRKLAGLVAAAAVLAAAVGYVWTTRADAPTADQAPKTVPTDRPANNGIQAGNQREQDDFVVTAWEVLGKTRWTPLRNDYHGATVHAVNRTSNDLPPGFGPALVAAYANAPGMFRASCEAVESLGKGPVDSKELLAATPREQTIPPAGKAYFACVQLVGTLPESWDDARGELRIDLKTATFFNLVHVL